MSAPPPVDGRRKYSLERFGRTWRETLVYAVAQAGGPRLFDVWHRRYRVDWRASGPSKWGSYYEQVGLTLIGPRRKENGGSVVHDLPLLKIRFSDHAPLPDSFRQHMLGIDIRLPLVLCQKTLLDLAPCPFATGRDLAPALADVAGEWRGRAPHWPEGLSAPLERFRLDVRSRGYGTKAFNRRVDLKRIAEQWWSRYDQAT